MGGIMAEIEAQSVDEAMGLIMRAIKGEDFDLFGGVSLGQWASTHVRLPAGYNSEINSPFLGAYSEIQDEVYRLVALSTGGTSDIRTLSQEQLDKYQLRVKVGKGSSVFSDNLPDILEKLAVQLAGKMTGTEAVVVILGLALLAASTYGVKVFLEARKEVKLEEVRTSERTRAIEALEFASKVQMEQAETIREAMRTTSEVSQRALLVADRSQEEILKAASKTNETVVGGDVHLTREEARILTSSPRKRSSRKIVEQEMKVVDVNTADAFHTTVVLEDPVTEKQFKVTFRDAILEERAREKVIGALANRGNSWFRLTAKEVDGEIVSYEINDVINAPDLGEDTQIGE